VIGLAVVGAIVGIAIAAFFPLNAVIWDCKQDEEIAADQRAAIGAFALDFVRRATGPDPTSTYELMTASMRQSAPPADKLGAVYREVLEKTGPVADWRVAHTYVVDRAGIGDDEQTVSCGNASDPEKHILVTVKGGPAQAHVLVEGDNLHHRVVFSLWTVMEGGRWRLIAGHMRYATYMGKSPSDFEAMAKTEQREQRPLNAALLYLQALALADRGPRFQLGIVPRLAEGLHAVKIPGPLAGAPPFSWTVDGASFKVLSVVPGGFGDREGRDQLFVVVTHEIDPWVDDDHADRRNWDLIAAFRKSYPSYSRQFAGVVVKVQPANPVAGARGRQTTYENEPGAPARAAADEASH
jgi:hypothetical protein